jgi:hypothetical protein
MALHLASLVIPLILNMCLIYTTFTMFIPIMGRAGSAVNPDLLIGYKAASMTLATMRFVSISFKIFYSRRCKMGSRLMGSFS